MKKIYITSVFALLAMVTMNAQKVIDISTIDAAYTKTVDNELVIDVATTASAVASPKLSIANPFKGLTLTEAEISFDVYNYGSLAHLGSLLAFYDATLGRMYFSNYSYLGYNATGGWFDVNMSNFAAGTDFIGSSSWKKVKLQFTSSGYAMYIDNVLAYNTSSTNATKAGNLTDYSNVLSFFKNASIVVFGTGSWWSDNKDGLGNYYDKQNSYLKNIQLSTTLSGTTAINESLVDSNSELISEEYFSITGSKMGDEYNSLVPGMYIKKTVYSNGTTKSDKIVKGQY